SQFPQPSWPCPPTPSMTERGNTPRVRLKIFRTVTCAGALSPHNIT
ncbi:uncharacterized protein METZ01_LOCUS231973, partial [marine metagenome]